VDLGLQAGDVGGPAGRLAAPVELDDGDRRFRGDAPDRAPQVFVEHDVAGHQNALARKAAEDV